MGMYEKYRNRLIKAVNEYNKDNEYKISFDHLEKLLDNILNDKEEKLTTKNVSYKCEKLYKNATKSIFEKMQGDIVEGKTNPDALKPIINNLRGLVREFSFLGLIESLDCDRKTKNKAYKEADSLIDHHDFGLYNNMYYKSIDTDQSDAIHPNLSKFEIKGINYQLKNFSGVIDYKNYLKSQNSYTSEKLIQLLNEDHTNKDTCKEGIDAADYLVKYEALKQMHNSRNFISRLFHRSERKAIKAAEENINQIIGKLQSPTNHDTFLAFVSKYIKGSEELNKFGVIFINSKNCVNYANTIRNDEDSLEVLGVSDSKKVNVKIEEKLVNNDLSISNDDLNKTFDEKEVLEESMDEEMTRK